MSETHAYTLVTRLAAGGMGEVYLAVRHGANGFQKRVALKLLLPHVSEDSQGMAMFLDEARLASKLDHSHIVPVIDFGKLGDRHFMAMPLVEGASMQQLLRAMRKAGLQLSLPLFRLIARGICDGLAYAHRAKDERGLPMHLVHRDMSPSNVLLSSTGGVFITDFGIARAVTNEHVTRTGQIRGKFSYMPPEQMLGLPVDGRADLYSTGVTLYELLTSTNPFKRETDPATIEAVRTDELTPPHVLRSDCTEGIDRALVKACARTPDERFESMEQLREALMDGPIASPHELGDFVSRVCGEALAKFNQTPLGPAEGEHHGQTMSVQSELTEPSSRPAERPAKVKWAVVALVMVPFAAIGAGMAVWLTRPPVVVEVPVVDAGVAPAKVVVTELPPPPPVEEIDAGAEVVTPVTVPKPKTVVKRGQAFLSIDASPWANVKVDGRALGQTPIAMQPMSAGAHSVEVLFSTGGAPLKRKVMLEGGETLTLLADGERRSFQLKRKK